MNACACIGPQNGEPVCPCRMKTYYDAGVGMIALAELAARQRYYKPTDADIRRLAADSSKGTD